MRREDFQAVGGYNEQLAIMEDADLTIRLHERGSNLAPGKVRRPPECARILVTVQRHFGQGVMVGQAGQAWPPCACCKPVLRDMVVATRTRARCHHDALYQ